MGKEGSPTHYLLLDANVVAGYYLPRSLRSQKAVERVTAIIDSVRSGAPGLFLYIPNFCIAEVFNVFAKYAFGWQVKNSEKLISSETYEEIRTQFRADIHNATLLYHLELGRYHVLASDLVSPVDQRFQIRRKSRKPGAKSRVLPPAGAFDQLIIAMGIHLAHVHGARYTWVVSADDRLIELLNRCRRPIAQNTIEELGLHERVGIAGKRFGPDLFPNGINLKYATKRELQQAVGSWPPPLSR